MDDKKLNEMISQYMSEDSQPSEELINITKKRVKNIRRRKSKDNRILIFILALLSSLLFIIQGYWIFTKFSPSVVEIGLMLYFFSSVSVSVTVIIYYYRDAFVAYFSNN